MSETRISVPAVDSNNLEIAGLKVALIAAPIIAVPPVDYGGTELFVAHLAEGLLKGHIQVAAYAHQSTGPLDKRTQP